LAANLHRLQARIVRTTCGAIYGFDRPLPQATAQFDAPAGRALALQPVAVAPSGSTQVSPSALILSRQSPPDWACRMARRGRGIDAIRMGTLAAALSGIIGRRAQSASAWMHKPAMTSWIDVRAHLRSRTQVEIGARRSERTLGNATALHPNRERDMHILRVQLDPIKANRIEASFCR
jgi:hypothetical protein